MEIEVRPINKKNILLVIILLGGHITCGCTTEECRKIDQNEAKVQSARELNKPYKGIHWIQIPPDKQKQTFYEEGEITYEAIYDKRGKVRNQVYPKIEDVFLHEDKFYFKVILPFELAGEVKVNSSTRNPIYLTKIDKLTYQVSLHEALDLTNFKFTLNYQPAAEDSVLAWEKTFEIPVIPEF